MVVSPVLKADPKSMPSRHPSASCVPETWRLVLKKRRRMHYLDKPWNRTSVCHSTTVDISSFIETLALCNGSELKKVSDPPQIWPSLDPSSLVVMSFVSHLLCHIQPAFSLVSFPAQGLKCYTHLPAVDLSATWYSHFILEGILRYK